LAYISIDGLYRAMGEHGRDNDAPQYCDACFSGEYPIALTDFTDVDNVSQMSLLAELA
ncbi:MAG: amidophosphoribosyltransferase, partial [Alphaproteobacteria bacterium]